MKRLLEKVKKLPKILKLVRSYLKDDESLLLDILEEEVLKTLAKYKDIGVDRVEELEDLLFHIRSYKDIPENLKDTDFSYIKDVGIAIKDEEHVVITSPKGKMPSKKQIEDYLNYLMDVEEQRAVEREFIFEHMKTLPLGFIF